MDIDIDDNGDGTFSVYYTVKDAGEYTLSIKFGGNPVPDGVYNFTVSLTLRMIFSFISTVTGKTGKANMKQNETFCSL